jgi:predicted  nucleic acid-binding Zn-ribbon protein
VKAAPAAQRRLLDLAGVDAELSRADHRRRTLPEQVAVEEAERTLRAAADAVVVAQTALSDLDRDVAKLDREVEQVRTRETRDRQLLDNGSVSAKQAGDLSHELESLERRRAVLEEEQLEVMERQEAAGIDLAHETEAHATAKTALEDAVERRDGVLGDIGVLEARRGEERTALLAELPADLVALYDQIRAKGAVGAGELTGNRCGACRLEMDRAELRDIQGAAPDEVVRCDNCGAIVVRKPVPGSSA